MSPPKIWKQNKQFADIHLRMIATCMFGAKINNCNGTKAVSTAFHLYIRKRQSHANGVIRSIGQ
jgi:hypothetical protein